MGDATGVEQMECVNDPEQTTVGASQYNTIAAQCCESDGTTCRRYVGNSNTGCIVGHSRWEAVTPTTYTQAVAICEEHGLQLCSVSCRNQGCFYNRHPVWTALPCEESATTGHGRNLAMQAGSGTSSGVVAIGAAATAILPLAFAGYMYHRRRHLSSPERPKSTLGPQVHTLI